MVRRWFKRRTGEERSETRDDYDDKKKKIIIITMIIWYKPKLSRGMEVDIASGLWTARSRVRIAAGSRAFLGAFEKLRKASISFVMSVHLSVWNNSALTGTDFHEIWYLNIFRKSLWKIQVSLQPFKKKKKTLYMKTNKHFWSHLAHFFLEWEMFQTKVVEKIKTHILCSVTFSRKSCRLWDTVEKYSTAGQATDGNMAHAYCTLRT